MRINFQEKPIHFKKETAQFTNLIQEVNESTSNYSALFQNNQNNQNYQNLNQSSQYETFEDGQQSQIN